MTSRLVETVMINVEEFAESFLTCGTCLCGYDSGEHSPKLLPCSHTVCRACLERILETQVRGETFRCPICREGITVPRGGANAFPPAFIVNQLLDLLASQRRNLVPKCSIHASQELLFCETCDKVFCARCTDGGHHEPGALAHNVISFNVAIKRCSEILLYKAHLCIQQLNSAHENVQGELDRLEENTNSCVIAINESFEEVKTMVQKLHRELLLQVRKISEEKRRSLSEQLSIIESERSVVQRQCDQLNYQVDVRNISKGINYLNEKLDKVATLTEPRENAYLRYSYKHNSALAELHAALTKFGKINTSTTYPALCSALVIPATVHLLNQVTIRTRDYYGDIQQEGGDPVTVDITDSQGALSSLRVEDKLDGSYLVKLRPQIAGKHKLCIKILDRPIKDSPFIMDVAAHQTPYWTCLKGPDDLNFFQPFGVAHRPSTTDLFVLDSGNSRVVLIDTETGEARCSLGEAAMTGQAGTGAVISQDGAGLWLVNWRQKQVSLVDIETDTVVQQLSSSELIDPTSITRNPVTQEILVGDNGAGRVLAWDPRAFTSSPRRVTAAGQVKKVYGLSITKRQELILAGNGLQILSPDGSSVRDLWQGPRSQFVGVWTLGDTMLTTRTERSRSVIQVFESPPYPFSDPIPEVLPSTSSHASGGGGGGSTCLHSPLTVMNEQAPTGLACYEIDSDTRLKRPAGLVGISDKDMVVVDAGTNKIHRLRFK